MNLLAQVDIGQSFFGQKGSFLSQTTDVGKLVSIFVSNAIVIAGVILLFFMIIGGIGLISGAGKNDPEKMAKSRQAIMTALIGFVIVFAAYWIVQLIGKLTGLEILGF